jgi:hypothetical protein
MVRNSRSRRRRRHHRGHHRVGRGLAGERDRVRRESSGDCDGRAVKSGGLSGGGEGDPLLIERYRVNFVGEGHGDRGESECLLVQRDAVACERDVLDAASR